MDCIGTGATSQTPSSHQRADFAHSWEHAPSPTQHIAKDLLNPEELCNSAVTHSAATGKLATRLKTPGGSVALVVAVRVQLRVHRRMYVTWDAGRRRG